MSDAPVRLYEGLFLIAQNASSDLGAAVEYVRNMLTRHGGEIVVLRKWDERKLAYPIKGQKRGLYILAYFKVQTSQLVAIEREASLSETVIRSMMIKADHVGEAELEIARKDENLSIEIKLKGKDVQAIPSAVPLNEIVPDLEGK